jgi:hypothetical protein
MILNLRLLAGGLALLSCCGSLAAQATSLSKEEITGATRTDDFSIPSPAELMASLSKQGKPDWTTKFRPPIGTSYPSRAQLALNLGSLVADGLIAVEAEDSQQVKNLGRDILQIAKNLGVPQSIVMRGSSITDFAERKQWDQLKEELEATVNEVKESMHDSKDEDLVTLVTVGAWARGVEVISSHIVDRYSEGSAKILRQPAILSYLNKKLDGLAEKTRDDAKVKTVRLKMIEMELLVSFPRDKAASLEDVKKLHTISSELVRDLAKKPIK